MKTEFVIVFSNRLYLMPTDNFSADIREAAKFHNEEFALRRITEWVLANHYLNTVDYYLMKMFRIERHVTEEHNTSRG